MVDVQTFRDEATLAPLPFRTLNWYTIPDLSAVLSLNWDDIHGFQNKSAAIFLKLFQVKALFQQKTSHAHWTSFLCEIRQIRGIPSQSPAVITGKSRETGLRQGSLNVTVLKVLITSLLCTLLGLYTCRQRDSKNCGFSWEFLVTAVLITVSCSCSLINRDHSDCPNSFFSAGN